MKTTYCCKCNVPILMEDELYLDLQRTGRSFSCINGHSQYFTESLNSSLERAKKEIETLNKQRDDWKRWYNIKTNENNLLNHRISGYKGMIKRLQNKIKTYENNNL